MVVYSPFSGSYNISSLPYTAQKIKFTIKDFFSKCDLSWNKFTAGSVTITEEMHHGTLLFFGQCYFERHIPLIFFCRILRVLNHVGF